MPHRLSEEFLGSWAASPVPGIWTAEKHHQSRDPDFSAVLQPRAPPAATPAHCTRGAGVKESRLHRRWTRSPRGVQGGLVDTEAVPVRTADH